MTGAVSELAARWARIGVPALLLGVGVACARQSAPPGGPPDRIPPVVVGTDPVPGAVLEGPRESVRIQFSERISERTSAGPLDDAVEVSPLTGRVRVEHSRDALEVTLQGGFREGFVYRVTVVPIVEDMFDNTMRSPFEMVFSTGPELDPAVVAGTVEDRLTLEALDGMRVNAVPVDDTSGVAHTALADTAGIFALRYIPGGLYRVTGFQDVNRNRAPDPFETQASVLTNLETADTVFLSFRTLVPDTTPAVLADAEVDDSLTVVLSFDDYLDPEWSLDEVQVLLSDSVNPVPEVERLLHQFQLEDFRRARADSIAEARAQAQFDSLVAVVDSLTALAAETGDTTLVIPELPTREPAPPEEEEEEPEEPLPAQALVVILRTPLVPDADMGVEVSGIQNISGLTGGGGTIAMKVPPPPPPDTLEADSLSAADSAAADSASLLDTLGVAGDSTAPGDTLAPPDTLQPGDSALGADSTSLPDSLQPPDTLQPGDSAQTPDSSSPPDTTRARDRPPSAGTSGYAWLPGLTPGNSSRPVVLLRPGGRGR